MGLSYRDFIEGSEFIIVEIEPMDWVTPNKLAKELYTIFHIPEEKINWHILNDYLCSWWTDKDNYCFKIKKSAHIKVQYPELYEDLIHLLENMQKYLIGINKRMLIELV